MYFINEPSVKETTLVKKIIQYNEPPYHVWEGTLA